MRRDSVKMMAFSAAPSSVALAKAMCERLEQRLALGVVVDRGGELGERVEVGDLLLEGLAVGLARALRPVSSSAHSSAVSSSAS